MHQRNVINRLCFRLYFTLFIILNEYEVTCFVCLSTSLFSGGIPIMTMAAQNMLQIMFLRYFLYIRYCYTQLIAGP